MSLCMIIWERAKKECKEYVESRDELTLFQDSVCSMESLAGGRRTMQDLSLQAVLSETSAWLPRAELNLLATTLV